MEGGDGGKYKTFSTVVFHFQDLGQKNFGHTTCPTCGMVYTSTQPEDETYHVKFHQKVMLALRFNVCRLADWAPVFMTGVSYRWFRAKGF